MEKSLCGRNLPDNESINFIAVVSGELSRSMNEMEHQLNVVQILCVKSAKS